MESVGIFRPSEGKYRLHHIVCKTDSFAKEGRVTLKKYGVGINSAAHGVYLSNHSGRHKKEYSLYVAERLDEATSTEEVILILRQIKEKILDGTLKLNNK